MVLGHSERQHYFGETNALVAEKYASHLPTSYYPFAAAARRAHGDYLGFVKTQLRDRLFHLSAAAFGAVMVAAEPLRAIGTVAAAQAMRTALRGFQTRNPV
ncbi:triose-phosphate isomerase [Hymenobacter sp. H14-R3]|uniref:triose-phosphate isomerase n=1 Tax=Hymenobacter sp. H14-R3 TaxID=3046308 RepID=UPI0024BA3B4A|nr:triose-phosphate isomerase [Hymenobacter sp. H14-R3]MDJ0367795.1 triose-phosphate isomerase [Hymenobacter sp. H14-R3]